MIDEVIREIRTQLRHSMNGVVSSSMREKGVAYKLNFGVSLPRIREIAAAHPKDSTLAAALWKEDVRELKILATMLQPPGAFTREDALRWALDVRYQEIAEQYCVNLLQELPFAGELAEDWVGRGEGYLPALGFLLFARLCMRGAALPPGQAASLLREAVRVMDAGVSKEQRAAVTALKRYGRQSPQQAAGVLEKIGEYASSDSPEKREFYADIQFEFDYYR